MWVWLVLGLVGGGAGEEACARGLVWNVQTYLSPSLGWDLQLCCGVERIWAAALAPAWTLTLPPAIPSVPIHNLSLPGSEFVVSTCSDGTVSQGFVPNRRGLTCDHRTGRIARLLPSVGGLENNRWYALCFARATQEAPCRSCSLERFCANLWDPDCTAIWLQRFVVNVRNDSLTLLHLAGARMPFTGRLSVVLFDQYRNDSQLFATSIDHVEPGRNYTMPIDVGVRPDSWYRVRSCLHFTIPQRFLSAYPVLMTAHQVKCLDDESYKTLSTVASAAPPLLPTLLCLLGALASRL